LFFPSRYSLLLGAAFAIACTTPPPRTEPLHSALSKADIEIFLGLEPDTCVPSGPELELCVWRYIGNKHPSWRALAREADTSARVNVVCEFSITDGMRSQEICTVHPARDKTHYDDYQRTRDAKAMLAEARTIGELSRLVGDVPNRCVGGELHQQRCVWLLTGRTEGRAILVATIGRNGILARLTCSLPLDGSARNRDSCIVDGE
jgi:hypothetical protein